MMYNNKMQNMSYNQFFIFLLHKNFLTILDYE